MDALFKFVDGKKTYLVVLGLMALNLWSADAGFDAQLDLL
jgi:hypothetical protein